MTLNIDKIKMYARQLSENFSVSVVSNLLRELKRGGFSDQEYYLYADAINVVTNKLADTVSLDIKFIKPNDKGYNLYPSLFHESNVAVLNIAYNFFCRNTGNNYTYFINLSKSTNENVMYFGNMRTWVNNKISKLSLGYSNLKDGLFQITKDQEFEKILGYFCNTNLKRSDLTDEEFSKFVSEEQLISRRRPYLPSSKTDRPLENEERSVVIQSMDRYKKSIGINSIGMGYGHSTTDAKESLTAKIPLWSPSSRPFRAVTEDLIGEVIKQDQQGNFIIEPGQSDGDSFTITNKPLSSKIVSKEHLESVCDVLQILSEEEQDTDE